MTYATAAELQSLTGCEHANADLVLDLASSAVDSHVGHTLTSAQEGVVLAPSGPHILWVVPAGWPLTVSSVVEDDVTLTEGEDFRVRADGALRRLGDEVWGEAVEVTYETGFGVDSPELLTAKRIVLELAARAVANPQMLDTISVEDASPSFVVRDGQGVLPQLTLSAAQRADLRPLIWRRRLA